MHTKKICFFNSNPAWGGGEKWLADFATRARDHGFTVFVATGKGTALQERMQAEQGIVHNSFAVSNLSFLNPLLQYRLSRYFKVNAVDIVIMSLPADLKAAGRAALRAGVPQRIYRRGIDRPVADTFFNRYLYDTVMTKLICNSVQTKRSVLQNSPTLIPPERIAVLPNGFDVEAFDQQHSTTPSFRKTHGVVIGTAGRLTAQKGQSLLLEAVALLTRQNHDINLVIAGTGEQEEALKARTQELRLEAHVHFAGFISNKDMRSFYDSLDIFVLPSLFEGFGYALVEAMAASLPVLAYNLSSNTEIIQHNTTGLLAAEPTAESLAQTIEPLLYNTTLQQSLGQAARQHVLKHFAIDKCFKDFCEVIGYGSAS